jgi:glycosyltransferase involved in cell wall biosynthesis
VHLNPSFNAKAMLRDGALLLTLRAIGQRNVVVFFHGWDEALAARVARSGWRRRLFCWVFGWPPLTFVLASSFRDTLLQIGLEPRRVRVTTTMFDGSLFSDLSRSRSDDGETRLVFMSRFVAEKGIHELLQAFVRLAEEFPGLRLVLLGDGPERPALEARAQEAGLAERVDFAGYVRGHEKAQALVDADIFVFPTYYGEGCPVVLLEAMAAGLPVITHGAGGIPDVFEDGRNGILLSTVTGESVADAVRRMLTAPEVRSAIGAHNQREAWARYEAGVVSGQMLAAYQELT